jgi:hypothetical protein
MLKLTLISAVLLGIGFAGIAIKIWAKKDGEFDGTCSSRNTSGKGCACGGGGTCENDSNHSHNHDRKEEYFDGPPIISIKKVG